jgi:hypothetical protein
MGLSKDESEENRERAWHRQTSDLVALLGLDYAPEGFPRVGCHRHSCCARSLRRSFKSLGFLRAIIPVKTVSGCFAVGEKSLELIDFVRPDSQ